MSPVRLPRLPLAAVLALSITCASSPIASARTREQPQSAPTPVVLPTRQPYVSVPDPRPPTDLRRRNSVVMDVDFVEQATASGSDGVQISGTIQLILDRIAEQTAPFNLYGTPRSILWVPVTADKECHNSSDAGILEVRVARFVSQSRSFVIIGRQMVEADLSFRLFDCAGRQLLAYPTDGSSYGVARFSPYFFSVTGTAGTLALATSHSNNNSVAATVGIVNSYGALQANIGEHDGNNARQIALYRLIGNIPGDKVPPPAAGSVASLLGTCAFRVDTDHYIRLHCGGH